MRKLIVLAVVALMSVGANIALADPRDEPGPGPNGSNEHGLCTAYHNGNKNGWGKNGTPPPFVGLEDRAEAADQTVTEFCGELTGGNPGPNGNSEGKGKGGN